MLPFNLQLIFAFVFGLTIAVSLMLHYRLPLKRSIVTPPSACPSCGYRIRFYDNIPVLSYLMLWGRCRKCGTHISLIYPAVELATGLISMALLVKYNILNSNFPEFFIYLIFISALICIGFIDLETPDNT
jgi:leader peptidase (prepilin peptidase)/N-methyltransferase